MGNEKKKKNSEDKDEEAINEMNDFSEETKKNRFHKKKDKVYIVHKMKEKEQKVDEENDHEHDEKIKDEAKEKKRKANQ